MPLLRDIIIAPSFHLSICSCFVTFYQFMGILIKFPIIVEDCMKGVFHTKFKATHQWQGHISCAFFTGGVRSCVWKFEKSELHWLIVCEFHYREARYNVCRSVVWAVNFCHSYKKLFELLSRGIGFGFCSRYLQIVFCRFWLLVWAVCCYIHGTEVRSRLIVLWSDRSRSLTHLGIDYF